MDSSAKPANHRQLCAVCQRPLRACICHWITPVINQVDVLILQHPAEVHHAKGSARLLHLSLAHSHVEVGEIFTEVALKNLLHGTHAEPRYPVLLYPATPGIAPQSSLDATALAQLSSLRLVIIDATWRKSLKMLHHNPLLQTLPRYALHHAPPSAYLIRKAHHAHQLSTLEATCHALACIENAPQRYQDLMVSFEGFVAQQMSFREHH